MSIFKLLSCKQADHYRLFDQCSPDSEFLYKHWEDVERCSRSYHSPHHIDWFQLEVIAQYSRYDEYTPDKIKKQGREMGRHDADTLYNSQN